MVWNTIFFLKPASSLDKNCLWHITGACRPGHWPLTAARRRETEIQSSSGEIQFSEQEIRFSSAWTSILPVSHTNRQATSTLLTNQGQLQLCLSYRNPIDLSDKSYCGSYLLEVRCHWGVVTSEHWPGTCQERHRSPGHCRRVVKGNTTPDWPEHQVAWTPSGQEGKQTHNWPGRVQWNCLWPGHSNTWLARITLWPVGQ
jgi:hypothetical protein